MSTRLNRRRFLHTSAAAVLGTGVLQGAVAKSSANDRLQVGAIGVAGQGGWDMEQIATAGAEIVALCDVDENRAAGARTRFPRASFYPDFHRLLEQKGLDAVVIGTPDHTHAVATMAALKAGLHVYCEKPLTHTVAEARLVAETAAKHKRVTQMGTQIHAGDNYRRVIELVQTGAIGPVREVHVWVSTSYAADTRPPEGPVPQGLHYDLWLGPAAERPYAKDYVPFFWRRYWAFGGGALADMACHYMDLPFWALKLVHPVKVAAEGEPSPANPEGAARWLTVRYEFPSRGDLPPVKLTWYDGGKRPKLLEERKLPGWGNGVLFVGDKGMLFSDYGSHKLLPEEQYKDFQPPKPFIAKSIGHHREWVEACKNGSSTTCNFSYSGPLTEAVLLGNVSYRLGRPLTWDAKSLRATNEPGAEKFLRTEYRKGWTL